MRSTSPALVVSPSTRLKPDQRGLSERLAYRRSKCSATRRLGLVVLAHVPLLSGCGMSGQPTAI